MMIKNLVSRICYRVWQFKQVLLPRLDRMAWQKAISGLAPSLQRQLAILKKSEKAHVMRVYQDVYSDRALDEQTRLLLLELALLHDIGKTITRPTILFKVAKVLFSFANTEHCLEGARFLRRQGQQRPLIRRVLRHHDVSTSDQVLKLFQMYDDRN